MISVNLRKPIPKARRALAVAAGCGVLLCLALVAPAASFALTLSPSSSTNLVGTTQTLTATGAVPGSLVNFAVTSGPNAGVSIPTVAADGGGTAVSSYVGAIAGLDTVAACNDPDQDEFTNNFSSCSDEAKGNTAPDDAALSNDASITWVIAVVVT